jgi:serine/threonine-protein kinase
VFLSYAHADQARVAKIAEALSAAGLKVWWDTALETGSRFSADIERELNASDAVLVVWSAASVASAWVLDEAGHGRDGGRLVPVRIDDVTPPLGFRQYQSTDLSAWKGRASDPKFQAVVAAIQKLASSSAPAIPAPATLAPVVARPTGPSRRALIGGVAGVAALAAGGFGAWKAFGGKGNDGTASVAVLPFANLSGDPAQAFFSDGIAEELRNALAQVPGLKVIGRVSSEKFRDADDLSDAAEKLGVDHVLTGSVRRSPTTIRIGAQLIDGKTGVASWSQSYDRPAGDALAVQSSIASNVVAALSERLGKTIGTIAVGGTKNPAAQELFLKSAALAKQGGSEANMRKRLALLDAAIALDPDYAEAHARRGGQLAELASAIEGSVATRDAMYRDALASTRRAVALAPTSGYVRIASAARLTDSLDYRGALAEAEEALRLSPGDTRVLSNFSGLATTFDPTRAVALAQGAVARDPFNTIASRAYARALIASRRFSEAVDAARVAMSLSHNGAGAEPLIEALLWSGQYDPARKLIPKLDEDWQRLTYTAMLEARAGNRAASDAALAGLRKIDDGTLHYQFAQILAVRGETAAALDEIEAAYRTRDPGLQGVTIDPALDPLRKEPRFKAVQDKVIPPDLFVPPKRV